MGVLNVTPDSFSDGGRFLELGSAISHAERMISEGVDIIDIGGESTRPGADPVDIQAEIERVLPVVTALRKKFDIPISIDTYKSEVAEACITAGADMINDISGLRHDPRMASVTARHGVPVAVMHMKGEPRTMQENPVYENLIEEVKGFLAGSIEIAVNSGVPKERVIIDPGIGFGKTFPHNFSILKNLSSFAELGAPILVGASRKSFLGSLSGSDPDDRFEESLAAALIAAVEGAHILRVHDVAASRRILRVYDSVAQAD